MLETQSWHLIRNLQSSLTKKEKGGYFSFSLIHPQRKVHVKSYHCAVEDDQAIQSILNNLRLMNQLGWGCYLGIASRRQRLTAYQRGGKKDLLALPALFVDIDQPPAKAKAILATVMQASLVVSSGNGLHAYWFLEEASQDFVQADSILKGFAQAINGDSSMSGDQILRLPKSWHHKDPQAIKVCEILETHPHRYRLEDFQKYIPANPAAMTITQMPKKPRCARMRFKSQKQKQLNPDLLQTLLAELRQAYQASPYQGKGWYKCLCIYPHQHDYPGSHAYYHPEKGLFHCFGRHGQKLVWEVARDLQIDIDASGGLWQH